MIDILNKYNIGKKKLIAFGVFVILFLVALSLTLIQVQKQQNLKQRAEGIESLHLEFSPLALSTKKEESFNTSISLQNPMQKDISAIDAVITYNSDVLELNSFEPNVESSGFTTIVNDTSIPGKIHYVGVNSNPTSHNTSGFFFGRLSFKGKGQGIGTVGFSNILVTAQGETEPLVINPSDNKPGAYTVGEPTLISYPTPTSFSSSSQSVSPSAAPQTLYNCGATKIVRCSPLYGNNGANLSWLLIDDATNYRLEWCYKNADFSESYFKDGMCGFITDPNTSVTIIFPGGAKDTEYKVRVRSEASNSCPQQPGVWSEVISCTTVLSTPTPAPPPSIPEPPKVKLTLDKQVYFTGEAIRLSSKVDFGADGFFLYYRNSTSNELFDFFTQDEKNRLFVICDPTQECLKTLNIPGGEGKILNLLVVPHTPKYSGFILTKDKPRDIYGKQVQLLEIKREDQKIKVSLGNSTFDIAFGKYYLVEGLAISLEYIRDNYVLVGVHEVKSLPIRHFSANMDPSSGSPGTLFTINAKTEINSEVKAIINGPGINAERATLYDDGNHGDGPAKDGVYGYVFHSLDSQIGVYTANFTVDNQQISDVISVRTNYYNNECIPFTNLEGNLFNKINIVIMPDNYSESELDQFQSKVLPRHANFLLSKEPYLSNKDKFNVWFIKRASSIDCAYGKWDCLSEAEKIISQVCPFVDKAIVLDKHNFGGYAIYMIKRALVNAASILGSEGATLHEFGHIMGDLADEYKDNPARTSDTSKANCDIFACPKWCEGTSSFEEPQCHKIGNEQECKNRNYNGFSCIWDTNKKRCDFPYFSNINFGQSCSQNNVCLYGCAQSGGYRSSNYSIMGDTNNNEVREYDTVSKIQIQKMIDLLWKQKGN